MHDCLANYESGTGTDTLVFGYRVQYGDADSNGLSIAANALKLNAGTINASSGGTAANLDLTGHTLTNSGAPIRKGNDGIGIVQILTHDNRGTDTYRYGEVIWATIVFDDNHVTTWETPVTMQLRLTIGDKVRLMEYDSGHNNDRWAFRYTVQPSDLDTDGYSIVGDVLVNGNFSPLNTQQFISRNPGRKAIINSEQHKVNGALGAPPWVSGVTLNSPVGGDTYFVGDTILATVEFTEPVNVVTTGGTPQLGLQIGSSTRQAPYVSGTGTTDLVFRYVVVAADSDTDGLAVPSAALGLNGGTIADTTSTATAALLSLGDEALANQAGHKVDGSVAVGVAGLALTSSPASGDTYGLGEAIEARVTFNRSVTVTGTPQLDLLLGTDTVQADYTGGTGTSALTFRHRVASGDADADGLSVDTLKLNSGTIVDARAGGAAAGLVLGAHAISDAGDHKVDGSVEVAPVVTGVEFASTPTGGVYGLTERIEVAVTFDKLVVVDTTSGKPQLALGIDSATRQAEYARGTATTTLTFGYEVTLGDADTDGISIGASALALNGGTITISGGTTAAALGLGSHAVSNAAGHLVDANQGPPAVLSVTLNSPVAGDTYFAGDTVLATVEFNKPVNVVTSGGTPQLGLRIGSNTRQAGYVSGTGSADLVFRYVVASGDADTDGISVEGDALGLNGGTIADTTSAATAALLPIEEGRRISNSPGHKVDGSAAVGVAGLALTSSPASSDTYGLAEPIVARVTFTRAVAVTGTPQLDLVLGTDTVQADYVSGGGGTALTFRHVVESGNADTDGLDVPGDALKLNSGTINDARSGGAAAGLALGSHAITTAADHKVDGSVELAPAVTSVTIASAPADGAVYGLSERIEVKVAFHLAVDVATGGGSPQLALGIGSETRQAAYASGTGTDTLTFRYQVVLSDSDANGISIGASALTLNGGTILITGGTEAAALGLGSHAVSNAAGHRVDGSIGPPGVTGLTLSDPVVGDTYEFKDTIKVVVRFNKAVDVTTTGGTPQLTLGITNPRTAPYVSGTGTTELTFQYEVMAVDLDNDGISIGASALALNGGTIKVAGGTVDAELSLADHVITNSAGHKVYGNYYAAAVSGVSVSSTPPVASTYGRDEAIEVEVTFTRGVNVVTTGGTPQLALEVGANTRQASYVSGTGTKVLTFRYVVVALDEDTDGIEVGASALTLNSGAINDVRRTTPLAASLGLGTHALTTPQAGHQVDGTIAPASVAGLGITSSPASGDTYGLGERIEAALNFDRPVVVTGVPQLEVEMAGVLRQARYVNGSGGTLLRFEYWVQGAGSGGAGPGGVDQTTSGISVSLGALTLNGGTIKNAADGVRDASLSLAGHELPDDSDHKVDGGVEVAPVVMSARVASTPSGASYRAGEEIEVRLTFSRPVAVTGVPRLALVIGNARRMAAYVSGSGTNELAFRYRVLPADTDPDGFDVPEDALEVGAGASIVIAGGSAVADVALGSAALENVEGQGVTGGGGTDPYFGAAEYEFELVEDVAGPLVVGTVTAEDPFGGEVTYELGDGSEGLFELDAESGDVTYVGEGADAEVRSNYVMEVRALAGDGRVGRAVVRVLVVNVNDPPAFVAERFEFGLPENAVGPVAVGVAEAVDLDEGDTLTYALESGGGEGLFELDAATGEVTYVGAGEDYEAEDGAKSWELAVSATDLAGLRDEAAVTVLLRDENEAPAFADSAYAFGLAENAAGPLVLGKVAATDPDAGDRARYSLAEGDADRFEVVAASGVVRYVGGGEDAEAGPSGWELVVRATDGGGLTADVRVEVSVMDQNEPPVFGTEHYEWELNEGVAGPVALGMVAATDADMADTVRYLLAGAVSSERFEVDAATGEVRYAGPGEDYETGPTSWEFTVVAVDRAGLSATATATVTLLDVNEAPVFADSAYAYELSENMPGPMALGMVEATDEDEGDIVQYSLADGDAGHFEVDGATGEVRYVGTGEDYESGPPEYVLVVQATDAGGLADTASVTVAVLNENEAPVFADSAYAFELSENARGPVMLGEVEATDPDEGDALTYSLARGDASRFQVDASSGEVRYVGPGEDYEAGPASFALTVRVEDMGGLSDEARATVELLDENEGPEAVGTMAPKVLEAYGAAAEEELGPYFRDPDGDALSYVAESSAPGVAIASVTAGGRLSIAPQALGMATVTVTASDPGGLTATQRVQVTVEPSRAERARTLQMALTAFGRSLGAETVDVIGGRLSLESSSAGSHVNLGGRSLDCGSFGGELGSQQCGIGSLARSTSEFLGMQLTAPRAAGAGLGGGAHAAGAHLDMAALLFGGGGAMGGPGTLDATGGFGAGGTYRGQQKDADRIERGSITFDPLSGRDLLTGSSFQLSFGGNAAGGPDSATGNDAPASGSDAADAPDGAAPQASPSRSGWTLWGQANGSEFESAPNDGLLLEGGTRSIYAGLDYRFGSGLLLGLAGSRSALDSEFTSRHNGTGTVDARLTSLYPYLHWSPVEGLGLWGLVGAGRGSADLTEAVGGRFSTDIAMRMAAVGARQELIGPLALRADAFAVRIESDAAVDLAGVTAVAQRVRVAPELSGQWAVGEGAALQGRLELGGRWDGGDAESGLGAEAGAALGFAHVPTGFSFEARGRTLVVHQTSAFREWGAGFAVRLQPGRDQGGLSFSVEPSWGHGAGGAQSLWQAQTGLAPQQAAPLGNPTMPLVADAPGWTPDGLAMELGWGVVLPGGAQVTPFGRWSRHGVGGYRLNAGTRWEMLGTEPAEAGTPESGGRNDLDRRKGLGLRFAIDLFGEQVASGVQPRERRIGLLGKIGFK